MYGISVHHHELKIEVTYGAVKVRTTRAGNANPVPVAMQPPTAPGRNMHVELTSYRVRLAIYPPPIAVRFGTSKCLHTIVIISKENIDHARNHIFLEDKTRNFLPNLFQRT